MQRWGDLPPPDDNLAHDPNCEGTTEIGCPDEDEESASEGEDRPSIEDEQQPKEGSSGDSNTGEEDNGDDSIGSEDETSPEGSDEGTE